MTLTLALFDNRMFWPIPLIEKIKNVKKKIFFNNEFIYEGIKRIKLISKKSQVDFYRKNIRIQGRTLIPYIGQGIIYLDSFVFES